MSMRLVKNEHSQAATGNHDALMKYLTFYLGKELYAVNIMGVREIFEYSEVTAMPMMPDFVCGAINLRGNAVPVIDLAKRMRQGETDFSGRTCIVIVEMLYGDELLDVGVIVDSVNRVIDMKNSDIDSTPTFGGNIRADFLVGLGKVDDHFVIVLDMEKVLSMDDFEALSSVAQSYSQEGLDSPE